MVRENLCYRVTSVRPLGIARIYKVCPLFGILRGTDAQIIAVLTSIVIFGSLLDMSTVVRFNDNEKYRDLVLHIANQKLIVRY